MSENNKKEKNQGIMKSNGPENKDKKQPKKGGKMPNLQLPKVGPGNFWNNILTTIILLLLLTVGYSYIAERQDKPEELSISEVVEQVKAGEVREIIVRGSTLEVSYIDETRNSGEAKKETDAAVTETLTNLGVPEEALARVMIDVQEETGFRYWLLTLAPFMFPILLLAFFVWFFLRQVRGAGMQALNFGVSKARMIDPNDTSQRVTFDDVAGAKEAKEELKEIVDFLKNPKKFLDIGAQIPKGALLMGAPGTGKCVIGDTLLTTNKGLVRIDEVPKYFTVRADNTVEGLDIVALDPKTLSLTHTSASHWYSLGKQKTVRLTMDLGIPLEGTPEHPIVVVDEATGDFVFRHLEDVKKGDWIVVAHTTKMAGNYTTIPHEDVAYLLGVLTGDGCLTIKGRICLSTQDNEVLERVQAISKQHLAKTFSKTSSRTYDYELRDNAAKQRLIEWGLTETYAEHKKVPEWVRMAPLPVLAAYLRGLFDADGSVDKRGSVSFSSSSYELVHFVHQALLVLGVVSRLNSRKKKYNQKLHYYLTIYGDFVEQFQQTVGFTIAKKSERLSAVCARQRNTNINLVPHQQKPIESIWQRAIDGTTKTRDRAFYNQSLYKNIKRYIQGERTPSVSGVHTMLAGVTELAPSITSLPEVAYLKQVASGNFFFSRVKNVSSGMDAVYDLTVPHVHNFVANGCINHNTLLARAVAGEASVPFFSISGSEFVEMFVGVGASRVRDLFQMAKKASPAIIFVDEIDAVGRVRGTGVGGGNDEREQTLNQILVEMDGFEPTEKIIVLAATNRPDVLDPALLRPGRFDRRVTIDLPDREEREAILKIHSRKKPFAEDVNLSVIAQRTPGFSGADLYSLMNEGAILAARENRKKVSQFDLIRSIEKVMLGPERKSHVLSKREREITAYHEAGHALVASVLPYADPVQKISIISRGRAAGYTLKLPDTDRRIQSRREFLDDIAMTLGGYVTEEMIFNDLTTGPSNDLQVIAALARDMVTKYGMSDVLGPVALEAAPGRSITGALPEERGYSDEIAKKIDAEVKRIIEEGKQRAKDILLKHRGALDAIAQRLIEVETLERDEYESILKEHGIKIEDAYKELEKKYRSDPTKALEPEAALDDLREIKESERIGERDSKRDC